MNKKTGSEPDPTTSVPTRRERQEHLVRGIGQPKLQQPLLHQVRRLGPGVERAAVLLLPVAAQDRDHRVHPVRGLVHRRQGKSGQTEKKNPGAKS